MSDTNIEDLSREDLVRIVKRDRFVKEQQAQRIAGLLHENLELMAIIQEQQEDVASLKEAIAGYAAGNGEVMADASSP